MSNIVNHTVPVTIQVPVKAHGNMCRLAQQNNVNLSQYAFLLLMAAYSAKCGVNDDPAIVKAVEDFVGNDAGSSK